ncbi:MAG: T9SS type A sorting domain-containing protein [Candidatus Cloacimonetes bacterium]|nr:T9SS type A sorting domain-containing protein [Candidatus Cloacimonadota bacterium]
MKTLVILSVLFLLAGAWGLDFIPGTGNYTEPGLRNDVASFHTGNDDRHYYYTYPETEDHQWAVKYDFRSYFEGVDSTLFTPETVQIYLPALTGSGSLQVGLYSDEIFGPGTLITENSLAASELEIGWNELNMAAAADTVFWLVVNYTTGLLIDQYISASNGDGSHSYFWDPYYGDEGSWLNMSSNGFNSEFLFNLIGEFQLTVIDVEIADLRLEGELIPSAEITPVALIINNSASAVNDVVVTFKMDFPGYIARDTLYIEAMAAGEILEFPPQGELSYILDDEPGRYKFRVEVQVADDDIDNDDLDIYVNIFEYERENIMIENMVELGNSYSNGIWAAQSAWSAENYQIINIFPDSGDLIYYSPLAEERFHYYDIYNLPATVVDGDVHIGYLPDNYDAVLTEMLEATQTENSFLTITAMEGLVDTLDDVHVAVTLDRGGHKLPADFTLNSKLKCFIIEDDLPLTEIENGIVFLDTLRFALAPLSGLSNTVSVTKYTKFSQLYKFTPLHEDSFEYCSLLFFVQNETDKKIWASAMLSFNDFGIVSAEEEQLPDLAQYHVYPNPLFSGRELVIESSQRSMAETEISIYNIKGQKIRQLAMGSTGWDGTDYRNIPVSAGIYLLRITDTISSSYVKVAVIR